MIFNPGHLMWYASQFMVLEPRGPTNSGTPPDVDFAIDPPRLLKAGDVVELTIEGLGEQRQVCRSA